MKQVVIENPVINSPFTEPVRHFRFTDEGITNEVVDGRRSSSYFVPIARPRKKGQKQLVFDTEWTQDRIEENKLVNQIRARVKLWREGGYIGVTPTTSRLLDGPRPREEAVLLSDRGPGNRHLPYGSRAQIRRRLARKRASRRQ